MIIELSQTSELYSFFYSLAFAIGLCISIYEGVRRNYSLSTWLLISATVTFGLVIGSKVSGLNFSDLKSFFASNPLPSTGQKAAYSAFVFAMLSLWLVKSYLRFQQPVLDAFAFYLPAIMIIQRVGCLSAGCCFGHSTSAPWGISYTGTSFLRNSQIRDGILSSTELTTVPVHPVPLYYLIAAVLTITLLLRLRNKLKGNGKLFALSILCMSAFRFVIEFFRHPDSILGLTGSFLGLKTIQWVIIPLAVFLFFIVIRKEKNIYPLDYQVYSTRKNLTLVAILAMLAFFLRGWFTTEEMVVLHAQILISALVSAYHFFRENEKLRYKLAYFSLLPLSFILMGQTYPIDTNRANEFVRFNANFTTNNYGEPIYPATKVAQGCLGDYIAERDMDKPMGPNYFSYTVGGEVGFYLTESSYFLLGMEGQAEHYVNFSKPYNALRGNLYPHLGTEGDNYFGFRVGFRAGSIFQDAAVIGGNYHVLPAGKIWLGYKPLISIQASVFDSDFVGAGPSTYEFKLNLNFPSDNDINRYLGLGFGMYGYVIHDKYPHYVFLQTAFRHKNNWEIKPIIGTTIGKDLHFNAGLGLNYLFQ